MAAAGVGSAPESALLTELLDRMVRGDRTAGDLAAPLVYSQLHKMAVAAMRRERSSHPLQATALVHEAYLRLAGDEQFRIASRTHFFALASLAMRRVLVDQARNFRAAKRGGGMHHEAVHELQIADVGGMSVDLLLLDDALRRLESLDPRGAKIIELKYFGGLSEQEVADTLFITLRMVRRDWQHARVWLLNYLRGGESE